MKAKRSEQIQDRGSRHVGKGLLVEQMCEGQGGLRREMKETKIDAQLSALSKGRRWQRLLRL